MATVPEKRRYQIVVMGGGGVGKSCLTLRLIRGQFVERYDPTIEDSYTKDNFKLDDKICPIEIMDTAGQDTFVGMRDIYYRNGDGFLLVYSVTDSSSVKDVQERFEKMMIVRGLNPSDDIPPVTVVGNKCDLEPVVSAEDGRRFAQELHPNVRFMQTSAKTDLNVTDLFQDIVRRIDQEVTAKKTAPDNEDKSTTDCSCNLI